MRLRAVLVVILLILAAGCGQQPGAAQTDLDAAQTWVEGYLAAMGADVAAAAPYVADEVRVESGYTHEDERVGRSRYLEMGRGRYGGSGGEVTPGAIYVGESGAVVVSSLLEQWPGDRFVRPFLSQVVIGTEGIEGRYDRDSTSLLTSNPYGDADRRALPDALVGEDIAAAAVESWADEGWSLDRAGDHHVDGPRYDPDAPAVYVGLGGRFADELSEVWMLVSHPSACPGRIAVRLVLDDHGGVEREDWFPAIGALRSCPEEAPGGWLMGREAPVPLRDRVTGEVVTGGRVIEVRHGTDELEQGIVWAMDRFERLALPAPPVSSVAFDPYAPTCDQSLALSTFTGATTDVLLCGDAESLCDEDGCLTDRSSRRIMLHELAHAWLSAYVDTARQDSFVALMDLPSWDDTSWPWARRGIEWAAETLAWGLHDDPVGMFVFGDPSCPTLTSGFRLLTGREPAHTCG